MNLVEFNCLTLSCCLQVVGHGMSDSFLDRVREVAVEFFQLPAEEKQKHARAVNVIEGYGSDLVVSDAQVLDWCHRLFLRVFPVHQRRLNLWPQHPPEFRFSSPPSLLCSLSYFKLITIGG